MVNKDQKSKLAKFPPIIGKGFVIGFVDEIHGHGGDSFQAELTRNELNEVAKYYAQLIKMIELEFKTGNSGSTEIRLHPYAYERLTYLQQFLGEEEIKALLE